MGQIKCVVFDMGDTLLDTKTATRKTHLLAPEKKILAKNGYKFSRKHIVLAHKKMTKKTKGTTIGERRKNPLVFACVFLECIGIKPTKKLAKKCESSFYNARISQFKLLPGAREVLRYLKKKRTVLCVVTNTFTDSNTKVAKNRDIKKYFRHFLASHRFGSIKSELKIFRALLKKLNKGRKNKIKPGQCLMVGNDAKEDGAAKLVGMKVALLKPTLHRKEYVKKIKPDYMLGSLLDLKKIVK